MSKLPFRQRARRRLCFLAAGLGYDRPMQRWFDATLRANFDSTRRPVLKLKPLTEDDSA